MGKAISKAAGDFAAEEDTGVLGRRPNALVKATEAPYRP